MMYDAAACGRMTRAYVAGLAPRSPTYMRHHWDHAKGFLDDQGLAAARQEEETQWQQAQQDAGLDLVSPAYVATEDALRPLTELPGASEGALTRTFETNTFHRQPIIDAVPEDGLRPWVDSVRLETPWVLSLPSPYDALQRSDVEDEASVVACLADAVSYALASGAGLVRLQEPSAAYRPEETDLDAFTAWLEAVVGGHGKHCVVHFSQGDVLSRPELLKAVPCAVGFQVPTAADDLDLHGIRLHAGVIHGDSSLVEATSVGADAVSFCDATGATLEAITNGWDLEHVPHETGLRKLHALAAARPVEVAA